MQRERQLGAHSWAVTTMGTWGQPPRPPLNVLLRGQD